LAGGTYVVDGNGLDFEVENDGNAECEAVELPTYSDLTEVVRGVATWERTGDRLQLVTASGRRAALRRVLVADESDDGRRTVVPRIKYLDEDGLLVAVQEQQVSDTRHGPELVNWIAVSVGSSSRVDGPSWRAGRVSTSDTWAMSLPGSRRPPRQSSTAVDAQPGSCVVADLNSFRGQHPASLRLRVQAERVEIVVDEEQSTGGSDGHVDEVVGYLVGDCHAGSIELGVVDGLTSAWKRVNLEGAFLDPVVVAGPATYNGADPGVLEVRNVTAGSFEVRFREWDYLDGHHATGEMISYLVAERGVTELAGGNLVEAGEAVVTSSWTFVKTRGEFTTEPVVFTTVVGARGG
jgi:hypothetical protein